MCYPITSDFHSRSRTQRTEWHRIYTHLHKKAGEHALISGGERGSEVLQASRLQPPCHHSISRIPNALMVIKRGRRRRGIALLHLPGAGAGVALRPPLRRQFLSTYTTTTATTT